MLTKALAFFIILLYSSYQRSPDEFQINLDLPPQKRYLQLAKSKSSNINKFIDYLHTTKKYKRAFTVARFLSPVIKRLVGAQFYYECKGIAEGVKRHITEVIVFNYMYQLGAYNNFCTSIPVQINEGDFFLARNLDYGYQQYLAQNSVKLTYVKNGSPIFQTIGHAGLNGAHTGLSRFGYSVTLNQRIDAGLHKTLQQIFFKGCYNVPYLIQQTLRQASNLQQAFSKFLNTRVCASVYFILNGKGKNIVIEKERNGAHAIYENNNYLVQTNVDRNTNDPDTRRDVAEGKMQTLLRQNKLSRQNVWKILTQSPNKNNLTLLTVLLDTSRFTINATVWD